jgi:hypothetical protein
MSDATSVIESLPQAASAGLTPTNASLIPMFVPVCLFGFGAVVY